MTDKVGLKDIKRMYAESSAIAKLIRQRKDHPEPKTSNKANEQLEIIARDFALKYVKGFDPKAKLKPNEIISNSNAALERIERQYSDGFSKNIDGILSEIPQKDLEGLVGDQRVLKNTDDSGRKAISAYANYNNLEEIARSYESGSREFNKEQASVVQNAVKRATELYFEDVKKGAVEVEKTRQKKEGISDNLFLETIESVANLAIQMDRVQVDKDKIDSYVAKALKEQAAEAKKVYSAIDKKNDGTPLREALTKAVNNMVKSGEPRSYREAVDLIAS